MKTISYQEKNDQFCEQNRKLLEESESFTRKIKLLQAELSQCQPTRDRAIVTLDGDTAERCRDRATSCCGWRNKKVGDKRRPTE